MTKQEKENRLCRAYAKMNTKGRDALDRIVGQLTDVDAREVKQILPKTAEKNKGQEK
jgi:hypothetical protein